jgi:hypothetical protein
LSLILDAGALIAVERADRATATLIEAERRAGQAVVIPAGIVGQIWRGGARQARVARLLGAPDTSIEPLTDSVARTAGMLCGAAGAADVIDASVVLAARKYDATVISSDRGDLRALDSTIRVVDC